MRTAIRLKLDAARRVLEFTQQHPDSNPAVAAAVARLQAALTRACELGEHQRRSQHEAAEALAERDRITASLRSRLPHLVRLAAAVAAAEGKPELQLRTRRFQRGKLGGLTDLREGLVAASAHTDLLIRYGLPAGMVEELERALNQCVEAETSRAGHLTAAAAATRALEAAVEEACQAIRHLDALNRLRLAHDSVALAAWRTASVVRWAGRAGAPAPAHTPTRAWGPASVPAPPAPALFIPNSRPYRAPAAVSGSR